MPKNKVAVSNWFAPQPSGLKNQTPTYSETVMSFGHCSCPDCGTTLRIRDRTFVGRQVQCPECHISLVIELDRDEILTARKPPIDKSVKSAQAANRSAVMSDRPRGPAWIDGLRRAIGSPLMLAWALALAVTALVVVAMLRPAVRFRSPGSSVQPQPVANNPVTPDEAQSEHDASQHPLPELPSPNDPPAAPVADATTPANVPKPLSTNPTPSQRPGEGSAVKPIEAVAVKPPTSIPPPMPKIDFDAVLKQRLLSFDQAKPVSRRDLIELMEEMLGAPIRYDAAELGEKNLDKQVTFKTENTTLGGVLKFILDPAGWEFVTEETQLRIKPKPRE